MADRASVGATHLQSREQHGRRRSPAGARGATGRKASGGKLLLGFIAVVFAWQTVSVSARLLQRVSRLAEQRDHAGELIVDDVTFRLLDLADAQVDAEGALSAEGQALLDRAADREAMGESESVHAARAASIREAFSRDGVAGFRESSIPDGACGRPPRSGTLAADPFALLQPLAVVAFFLALAQVLQHVAGSEQDLARVGPGLEWLFSFPVRASSLFLARAVAAPLTSPLCWLVLFPFYAVVFCCSGQGALGVASAAAAAAVTWLCSAAACACCSRRRCGARCRPSACRGCRPCCSRSACSRSPRDIQWHFRPARAACSAGPQSCPTRCCMSR